MRGAVEAAGLGAGLDTAVGTILSVADESSSGTRRLVFVSHCGRDTWVAKQIAREIGTHGATPFLDEAQVDAGADFEEHILDFLQRAHELVVLLTPWAGITAAELQTRPGIPVLLKKRDHLELNDIEIYLTQLKARAIQKG